MDIAEILKKAKPPEATVDLCLDADLAAEHDELQRRLLEEHGTGPVTMADTGKTEELSRQILDLEERMRASIVTFRMRAISHFARQEWMEAHPPREGKDEAWNPLTGPPALIAACCIDPQMTEEDAVQLCTQLGVGQTDRLFRTAWEVTNGQGAVPFSAAASATIRASELKQK